MLTRYSVMRPSSQCTCCSLIHAPRILRSVLEALVRPCCTASSKLFEDVALISDTLATDILPPPAPGRRGLSTNPGGDSDISRAAGLLPSGHRRGVGPLGSRFRNVNAA